MQTITEKLPPFRTYRVTLANGYSYETQARCGLTEAQRAFGGIMDTYPDGPDGPEVLVPVVSVEAVDKHGLDAPPSHLTLAECAEFNSAIGMAEAAGVPWNFAKAFVCQKGYRHILTSDRKTIRAEWTTWKQRADASYARVCAAADADAAHRARKGCM